jgi:hypothetical protein
MAVGLLHNQDRLHNRLVREAAWQAPGLFGAARRLAIQAVLAARRARSAVAKRSPGDASNPAGQAG